MEFIEALVVAERRLAEGASVEELKEVVSDLRALSRESSLADLIELRIISIERDCGEQWC
jgi:hypothetical protein